MKTNRKQENTRQQLAENQSDVRERIAVLAYQKAEHRGFGPGHEWDDWIEAEREVLGQEKEGEGDTQDETFLRLPPVR